MLKVLLIFLGMGISIHVHAFQCYLTMVKDSCWTNYNVTVNMMNASTGKEVATIIVPEGQSWVRQAFTCQPREILSFQASFTPSFWKKDEGKVYPGHRYWNLPLAIKPDETAWNITVCYPNSFSGVPLPPEASGHCKCDIQSIPPVLPQ